MILAPRPGQNVLNIDHCTLFTLIPARAHCCKLFSDEYLVDRFQSKKISNVTPFFTQNATYSEKLWQERFSHITKTCIVAVKSYPHLKQGHWKRFTCTSFCRSEKRISISRHIPISSMSGKEEPTLVWNSQATGTPNSNVYGNWNQLQRWANGIATRCLSQFPQLVKEMNTDIG